MTATERSSLEQASLEMLAELLNQTTRQTSLLTELRGLSLNSVLWSGTVTLDERGHATIDNTAPFATFGVWALGDAVTVVAGTDQADPPTAGAGVFPIPAGSALVWAATGTALTIHGTAGDRVIVALWSVPQCPMVANGGGDLDGGGA